jgi:hypothetical protein
MFQYSIWIIEICWFIKIFHCFFWFWLLIFWKSNWVNKLSFWCSEFTWFGDIFRIVWNLNLVIQSFCTGNGTKIFLWGFPEFLVSEITHFFKMLVEWWIICVLNALIGFVRMTALSYHTVKVFLRLKSLLISN